MFPIDKESGFSLTKLLNSLIKFSFHSNLSSCQIPKNNVNDIQNKLNKKNFRGNLLIYAPQTYTQTKRKSHTTSTKCQYHAAASSPKCLFGVK